MAKTKYGMRMYRARAANAAEMQENGVREYTLSRAYGESLAVQEGARADQYTVTELSDGEPLPFGTHTSYSAGQIKNSFGVDIWKGQLKDGVTTNDLSDALYAVRDAKQSSLLAYKIQNYLTNQEDASTFTEADINAINAVGRRVVNLHRASYGNAARTLSALVSNIRNDQRRSGS